MQSSHHEDLELISDFSLTIGCRFYGDDDTVFFIDAAIRMAQGLDHNMPYFLSGPRLIIYVLPNLTKSIPDLQRHSLIEITASESLDFGASNFWRHCSSGSRYPTA